MKYLAFVLALVVSGCGGGGTPVTATYPLTGTWDAPAAPTGSQVWKFTADRKLYIPAAGGSGSAEMPGWVFSGNYRVEATLLIVSGPGGATSAVYNYQPVDATHFRAQQDSIGASWYTYTLR